MMISLCVAIMMLSEKQKKKYISVFIQWPFERLITTSLFFFCP